MPRILRPVKRPDIILTPGHREGRAACPGRGARAMPDVPAAADRIAAALNSIGHVLAYDDECSMTVRMVFEIIPAPRGRRGPVMPRRMGFVVLAMAMALSPAPARGQDASTADGLRTAQATSQARTHWQGTGHEGAVAAGRARGRGGGARDPETGGQRDRRGRRDDPGPQRHRLHRRSASAARCRSSSTTRRPAA